MTYYEDLSEYSYVPCQPRMLNVGWLGEGHPFRMGDVDLAVVLKLLVLADEPSNLMRGIHDCEFCEVDLEVPVDAPVPRGKVWLGSGEVHVEGADGTVYAAPTLIAHYIAAHGYQPPIEFVRAVLSESQE